MPETVSILSALIGEPVRLHSPMTPEEIRDRLKPELRWSLVEAGLMHGWATKRRLFLWLPRDRPFSRHVPLALIATLTRVADGTLIRGTFRLHPGNLVGLVAWLSLAIAFFIATGGLDLWAVAVLIALPLLLEALGLAASRGEEAELLDLLNILIGATPA